MILISHDVFRQSVGLDKGKIRFSLCVFTPNAQCASVAKGHHPGGVEATRRVQAEQRPTRVALTTVLADHIAGTDKQTGIRNHIPIGIRLQGTLRFSIGQHLQRHVFQGERGEICEKNQNNFEELPKQFLTGSHKLHV